MPSRTSRVKRIVSRAQCRFTAPGFFGRAPSVSDTWRVSGGGTPVPHDAARGPDEEPESTADHRRAPALRPAAGANSAPLTISPGSAPERATVPRRSPTACRIP